ncbi:MAG: hypothetical protein JWP31_79 [Aeromicrobium sp.]|nr:hypothetical protein [Aeromicrobium sp.]
MPVRLEWPTDMRSPHAAVASLLLAGSLVLAGCSAFSDNDATATAKPTPKPAATDLPSTAWRPAEPSTVAQGGTLRLAATTLPGSFNLQHVDAANSDAAKILAPTTGGAVHITAGGEWDTDPDYVESVTVADKKPLTIRVKLNRAAVWQGGSSITADDMIAFWKAQNGSNPDYEVASTAGYEDISAVTRGKDKFTYTVTFDKATAEWPLYIYPRLASNVSSSPKLFNDGFRSRAISSNGPYRVSSIDSKAGVVTEVRNPRWWGAKPKLDTITWNIADADVQAEAYAADELDAVDLTASSYRGAKGVGTVQRAAGVEWSQVTLNGGRGPLRDVDVRRAVAQAIDRDPIAKLAASGLGAPATSLGSLILVPEQTGYRDSSATIAHDPTAARRLLAKAGYTRGADGVMIRKGKRLTLTMPVPRSTPTNRDRARAIATDLKKVGIELRLRSVPARTFFDQYVVPLDFDLVTFVRRASAFPIRAAEPLFYPVDSPQNFTGLGADRLGKGWDATTGTLDDELRQRRIAKLDEWLFDDVPMVPLAVTPIVVAVRRGVVNYGAAQFEQPDWTRVGFAAKKKG